MWSEAFCSKADCETPQSMRAGRILFSGLFDLSVAVGCMLCAADGSRGRVDVGGSYGRLTALVDIGCWKLLSR